MYIIQESHGHSIKTKDNYCKKTEICNLDEDMYGINKSRMAKHRIQQTENYHSHLKISENDYYSLAQSPRNVAIRGPDVLSPPVTSSWHSSANNDWSRLKIK